MTDNNLPETLMVSIRGRNNIAEDDSSHDADLLARPAIESLRDAVAWNIGYPEWADEILNWAVMLGLQSESNKTMEDWRKTYVAIDY